MSEPKVWTERLPPGLVWDQCSECAYLMAMVHGGFDDFPLGAYTNAERDALTVASGLKVGDGKGALYGQIDAGVRRRYGLALRKVPITTSASLRAHLEPAGRAFAIAGDFKRTPASHPLRRWQPGFTGGHMICAITLGGGKLLWLDPLAPAGHAGDVVTIDDVLRFAWIQWETREVAAGEFLTEARKPLAYFKPAEGDVAASTPIHEYPGGPVGATTAARVVEAAILAEHPAGRPTWLMIGVGGRKTDIAGADLGVTVPDRLGWVRRSAVDVHNSPADPELIRAVGGALYRTLPVDGGLVVEKIVEVPTGVTRADLRAAAAAAFERGRNGATNAYTTAGTAAAMGVTDVIPPQED